MARNSSSAAYTRTPLFHKFVDQVTQSLPAEVNANYAATRLNLKGGDIRAFLQSIRVFGFTDDRGRPTPRLEAIRLVSRRAGAVIAGLEQAYPALVAMWRQNGPLSRRQVEDYFLSDYGLSAASAAAAAKLFLDLMREFSAGLQEISQPSQTVEAEVPAAALAAAPNSPQPSATFTLGVPGGIQHQININLTLDSSWETEKLLLVFDQIRSLAGHAGAEPV